MVPQMIIWARTLRRNDMVAIGGSQSSRDNRSTLCCCERKIVQERKRLVKLPLNPRLLRDFSYEVLLGQCPMSRLRYGKFPPCMGTITIALLRDRPWGSPYTFHSVSRQHPHSGASSHKLENSIH